MQELDWTALRSLVAFGRAGSLAAAGRLLGVDATTVARRLRALERAAGAALLLRGPDGAAELTPLGEDLLARAEAMATEADAIAERVGRARDRFVGTVRVTAVPMLVNRLLVPALPVLAARHPDLTVELVPESRDLSLTRREADLALRLGRPQAGGHAVRLARVGRLGYGVYAPAEGGGDGWIAYDAAMAHLPHARWLAEAAARDAAAPLRVMDAETALSAVAAGVGRSLLPSALAEGVSGLRRLADPPDPLPAREIWLLSHAAQARLAGVAAVVDWLRTDVLTGRLGPS